ncbi:glutathione S-transferase family protein [Cupriavidus sp. UME77]|uniref:glutathione S-transferase family protein n=1 Tax=Cupriavidus sp. UME77 TaxID=1862321 RepID=UPI0015FF9090|nr:glutathione S-transferase family protein [Cupriavidus sp. UME77]MBB1632492.1 glutathione S-transferase [Cupriavidus sp. UME77]
MLTISPESFAVTEEWPPADPKCIQLYSYPTSNRAKASIMLEETGLPYESHFVNLAAKEQLSPEFRSINPYQKIPAILDPNGPDGKPITVFESAAILLYLAEKSGKLMPSAVNEKIEAVQWLILQASGISPTFAQLVYFVNGAGKDIDDARPRERYISETQRLLAVLNQRLYGRRWTMGEEYTIVDIAVLSSVRLIAANQGLKDTVGMENYANVTGALSAFLDRPAVRKGLVVPAAA